MVRHSIPQSLLLACSSLPLACKATAVAWSLFVVFIFSRARLRSLRAVVSHRPRVLVSEWAVLRLQRWRRRSSCQLQLLIVRDMR
jgi:hypothetical protein